MMGVWGPLEGLVHRPGIAALARHRDRLDDLIASNPLADGGLIDPKAVSSALAQAARFQSATVIA